jgi:hypothetical protein
MVRITRKTPKLDKLQKEVKYLSKHGVKVGVFGSKAEQEQDGVKIYEYALYLNFGTVFMPERPFFDKAVKHKSGRNLIIAEQKEILRLVYNGTLTGKQGLTQLGIFIKQQIQEQIMSNDFAPLKAKTIKYKEKNKGNILRENDFLLNSINYEIVRI